MTAPTPQVPEGLACFLSDFVHEGYRVVPCGTHYQAFSLLSEARQIEESGNKPCIRFHRDATGRIDALELAVLVPKGPTLEVVGNGAGASNGNSEGTHTSPANLTISTDADASVSGHRTPSPQPRPCVKCEGPALGFRAMLSGFCESCRDEIEGDIALDDVERPKPLPRPYYGNVVDPFGGSAA